LLAFKRFEEIKDFLMNGDFDETEEGIMEEGTLNMPGKLNLLHMMDGYSSYAFNFNIDYVINLIKTIDFSNEKNPEKVTILPDLSEFTNLEKLILTGTSIKKLPDYIQKKVDGGVIEVVW
jgi:hypothetical protein